MTVRRCWVLLAAAAWTLYVWVSRLVIMWGGDESGAFKAVHTVLALVSIGFALSIAWIALDWRRTSKISRNSPGPETPESREKTALG